MTDSPTPNDELRQIVAEGSVALARLFSAYSEQLERMIAFRLDTRLKGRVDVADVLQEAYLEIARRVDEYIADPAVSVYVWMRQLTYQALIGLHRKHFSQKRSVNQERRSLRSATADETTNSMAQMVYSRLTTPSEAMMRMETVERLKKAFAAMDETDREVLALRHFEQLGNQEVAEILSLSPTAASNRYVRAVARLSKIMSSLDPPTT
ncbi:MAG: sigma-70 family RNA polymerase sigma factor [Planctomycetaceae bacterium]